MDAFLQRTLDTKLNLLCSGDKPVLLRRIETLTNLFISLRVEQLRTLQRVGFCIKASPKTFYFEFLTGKSGLLGMQFSFICTGLLQLPLAIIYPEVVRCHSKRMRILSYRFYCFPLTDDWSVAFLTLNVRIAHFWRVLWLEHAK